jgi:hypothetical protein
MANTQHHHETITTKGLFLSDAATAQTSLRASGRRAGSGVCTPELRLLTQTAPPLASEIPLPNPAIRLAAWIPTKGLSLSDYTIGVEKFII